MIANFPTPKKSRQKKSQANRGRDLESIVVASQGSAVRLDALPKCGAKFIGRNRFIRVPICCDFVGTILSSGRAIFFDAKQCDQATRFPIGNDTHIPAHQRLSLEVQGRAGALAGLLIEATHADVAAYFWADWSLLQTGEPSILWTDSRLVRLGSNRLTIPFALLVGDLQ